MAHACGTFDPVDLVVLLALDRIFGTDLPDNADFREQLIAKFIDLAQNGAVATASQILL